MGLCRKDPVHFIGSFLREVSIFNHARIVQHTIELAELPADARVGGFHFRANGHICRDAVDMQARRLPFRLLLLPFSAVIATAQNNGCVVILRKVQGEDAAQPAPSAGNPVHASLTEAGALGLRKLAYTSLLANARNCVPDFPGCGLAQLRAQNLRKAAVRQVRRVSNDRSRNARMLLARGSEQCRKRTRHSFRDSLRRKHRDAPLFRETFAQRGEDRLKTGFGVLCNAACRCGEHTKFNSRHGRRQALRNCGVRDEDQALGLVIHLAIPGLAIYGPMRQRGRLPLHAPEEQPVRRGSFLNRPNLISAKFQANAPVGIHHRDVATECLQRPGIREDGAVRRPAIHKLSQPERDQRLPIIRLFKQQSKHRLECAVEQARMPLHSTDFRHCELRQAFAIAINQRLNRAKGLPIANAPVGEARIERLSIHACGAASANCREVERRSFGRRSRRQAALEDSRAVAVSNLDRIGAQPSLHAKLDRAGAVRQIQWAQPHRIAQTEHGLAKDNRACGARHLQIRRTRYDDMAIHVVTLGVKRTGLKPGVEARFPLPRSILMQHRMKHNRRCLSLLDPIACSCERVMRKTDRLRFSPAIEQVPVRLPAAHPRLCPVFETLRCRRLGKPIRCYACGPHGSRLPVQPRRKIIQQRCPVHSHYGQPMLHRNTACLKRACNPLQIDVFAIAFEILAEVLDRLPQAVFGFCRDYDQDRDAGVRR